MDYKDYYKILEVDKSATKDQIRKQYKKLARKYHPDVNQGNKEAEEKFKLINEAHEVLSDDDKRQKYDTLGADWQRYQQTSGGNGGFDWGQYAQGGRGHQQGDFDGFGGGGGDFSDFFSQIFGNMGGGQRGRSRRPTKGQDYTTELSLTLQEAYAGGPKTIVVNGQQLRITLKPGVEDGQSIRLKGKGGPSGQGGEPGDLYITLRLQPDPRYTLKGADLYYDLEVPVYKAALGGEEIIETFSGKMKLKLAEATQNGTMLRLRGKGFPVNNQPGQFGDLYVKINVQVPGSLTEQEKELYRQLAKLRENVG